MTVLKREIDLLHHALVFLTRLPLPELKAYSDDKLSASARYFPWVGALVGAVAVLGFLVFHALFDHVLLAVLLSTALSCLFTGAFHEDGFADFCDGFGGGWQPEQVLDIMKDSRLGTYGALGLLMMLSVKILSLSALPVAIIPAALLLGHVLSRLLSTSLLLTLDYVRGEGKAKPLATRLSPRALAFASLALLFLLPLWPLAWGVLPVLIVLALVLRQGLSTYLTRRIGGYTGDCLGAAQQLSEVLVYLVMLAAAS